MGIDEKISRHDVVECDVVEPQVVISHAPSLVRVLARAAALPNLPYIQDRARGTMLGLAIGNLLGLPVEGGWYHHIARSYPGGVKDIEPSERFRPMDDDLAQAVELAESLLSGDDLASDFADRLVIWLRDNGKGCGSTTLAAIELLEQGFRPPDAARVVYEWSPIAPNGGLMRCAPVAIVHRNRPAQLVIDAAVSCAVTHYAPVCQWSCIVIDAVIASFLNGTQPDLGRLLGAAAEDGCPDLAATAHSDGIPTDVLDAVARGKQLPDGISWLLRDHGLIGHTLVAAQVGLWAAVTPLGFEEALVASVSAGGDADTNAAVAGAVLGARYGMGQIPRRWLDCIPQRERIEGLANDLSALNAW